MKQIHILCLSLFIIPLLGSIAIGPFINIPQADVAKEFFIFISIIALVLSGIVWRTDPQQKRPINYFMFALMMFIPLSIYSAPQLKLMYGFNNMGGLWIWKATLWIFAYFILYKAILFIPLAMDKSRDLVIKSIGWSAILSSGYAYLQWFGLDQWHFVRSAEQIGSPVASNITAMIGNPTYLGVWLVLCLPFLMLFFKFRYIFFVAGAIILTKSDFAFAGLIFSFVFLPAMRFKSPICLRAIVGGAILGIVLTWAFWGDIKPHITDNSRFGVWEQTLKDWMGPCIIMPITKGMSTAQRIEIQQINSKTYAFTGRGPGSFPHIYGYKYDSKWKSPHNVYLLCLYSIGLIGTVLFILAIGWILKRSFNPARGDPFQAALYCSAVFLCLAAIGTPIMGSETLRYFSVAIFAMLSPRKII